MPADNAKPRRPTTGQAENAAIDFNLPFRKSANCSVDLLTLDLNNPRLQTGKEFEIADESHLIAVLADIAALDELVLSICTNTYQNLEPLIVYGPDGGPYTVLEGNRRVAAIRLIRNPDLATSLGIHVPVPVQDEVLQSIKEVLVFRVAGHDDAREFIGFKHINGPQRWDAYAKARYVTDWYKSSNGTLTIDQIADKMGDNNNTLRSYIYAVLILEQAERAKIWTIKDRPTARGRFPFSHFYTAIGRNEYQEFLGLTGDWSSKPPVNPIKKAKLKDLGEVLTYIYGSESDGREPLVKSQNPDLKDLGLAIVNPTARLILKNRGTLDDARDAKKEPAAAFHDALVLAKLRLDKAIQLMPRYTKKNAAVEALIDEVFAQADILKTISESKRMKSER